MEAEEKDLGEVKPQGEVLGENEALVLSAK